MRAAAVALVLIIGAIVILWFGNTLNSWVLGGLIGGFAALLISIPISVVLFLYLSRQHEEKVKAEAEQNLSFEPSASYREERQIEFYDADADVLDDSEEDWYEEEDERTSTTGRNLPVPSYGRVPAVRQSQVLMGTSTGMMGVRQRSTGLPSARRSFPQSPPSAQRQYGAAFPKQVQKSARGQHHTAALHVARLEAMQQQADMDMYSPTTSKRLPVVRPDQRMVERPSISPSAQPEPRPSHQFQRPFPNQNSYRPRKVVDGTSIPAIPAINNPRSLPPEGGSTASRQTHHHSHFNEPETGQLSGQEPQTGQLPGDKYSPQTGPMRQQPRTGQIVRNPQIEEQRGKQGKQGSPERVSGSLQNPMVRRAPYMYEDDPLRQELARHLDLDAPVVRRSSRKLRYEEAEE